MQPRNVVLVGFMGAGKTTVANLLAAQLGLSVCDTDAELEQRAGSSIAQIFAEHGEAYFRRLESEVVQSAARRTGQVIATGGGALGDPASLQALLGGNLVVWLHAPLERLLSRAAAQGGRPLLQGASALERAAALYCARVPLYAQANLIVDADQPPELISRVITGYCRLAQNGGSVLQRVSIHLPGIPEHSYDVVVGAGVLSSLPSLLPMRPGKALLVSDANVAQLYGDSVAAQMQRAGWQIAKHVIQPGEAQKSLVSLRDVYSTCVAAGLERSSPIIALGGGVVGDLAGFAAATYLRGVPFVQVPTTLLAQVDASVGGKVAVNLPEGKNLVGAFYQPRVVVADVALLTSLPQRELLSGLAEVIKHGVIADPELFTYVDQHLDAILARDPAALRVCVSRSCEIKGAVVEADERESGLREVLNFGHTVGHAVEAVSGYGTYAHGEAVAIGMVTAAKLSVPGGFAEADVHRLIDLLRRAGLPVQAAQLSVDELLASMQHDKKVRNGQIRFALAPTLGKAQAGIGVDQAAIRAALDWQSKL